jgi:mycofactocin biosynthesis protein MftB
VRGLLSVAPARPPSALALDRPWRLSPQVALRDESFGAWAYHYGNRRLVFLKSRLLVELVSALDRYDTAGEALAAVVPQEQRLAYGQALRRLADSEVIDAR